MTNLRHFPIAVVNEDAGPAGAQIVDGLVAGLDKNKFDIRVLSHDEARHQLDTAQVYGEAVIPPTLFVEAARVRRRARSRPNRADRPSITISTNPRAGTLGSSIAGADPDSGDGRRQWQSGPTTYRPKWRRRPVAHR